jgi:hypothetical protein
MWGGERREGFSELNFHLFPAPCSSQPHDATSPPLALLLLHTHPQSECAPRRLPPDAASHLQHIFFPLTPPASHLQHIFFPLTPPMEVPSNEYNRTGEHAATLEGNWVEDRSE